MADTQTGRVASANEKGIKFDGADKWANFSKYAKDGAIAEGIKRGMTVEYVMDKDFIKELRIVSDAPTHGSGSPPGGNGYQSYDPNQVTMKDVLIIRQVCIKAVTDLAIADRENPVMPDDMLALASEFEAWILRPSEDVTKAKPVTESTGAGSSSAEPSEKKVAAAGDHTADEWWESLQRGVKAMREQGLKFEEEFDKTQLTLVQMRELVMEASNRIKASQQFDALVDQVKDIDPPVVKPDEVRLGTRSSTQILKLIGDIRERVGGKVAA